MSHRNLLRCGAAALAMGAVPAGAQDVAQTRVQADAAGVQSTAPNPTPVTPTTAGRPAQAGEADNASIADIIVTATRTETTLQNTPVAVTAISGAALEDRGVRSLQDVANFTPSLTVGTAGGRGGARGNYNIRGIGTDAPDSAPAVGIYIDEVYYPSTTGNLLGLFDVGRVEVLRGPQGTLFGRNTIAGAVQYISVKPSTTAGFTGLIDGDIRTIKGYRAAGALNIPLGSTLALRVGGQYRQDGGYVHDLLNGFDRGRIRTLQGRAQLRWTPTASFTADLKVEGVKVDSNGRANNIKAFDPTNAALFKTATGVTPGLPPPFIERRPFLPSYITPEGSYDTAGFDTPDYFTLRYKTANLNARYDISDHFGVKFISSYAETNTYTVLDFDTSPITISQAGIGREKIYLLTDELQLHGDLLDDRLHLTAGGFYYSSISRLTEQYNGLGLLRVQLPDTRSRIRATAIYGQGTLDLFSGISATAGLRFSREKLRNTYLAGGFADTNFEFKNTSPYFGLNWQATPDVLVYAKASEGYRAGGTHLSAGYPTGALYYRPETAWTYEAGTRLSFLDNRIRFNPTIYQTNWKNVQFVDVQITSVGPQAGTANAGDARLKGLELETQFQVSRNFQLHGAFSYLDANYTRLDPPMPGSIPRQITIDSELPRSPKTKYTVGGNYTLPLDGGSELSFSSNYSFTARQRSSADGNQNVPMPSYGLLDARIEYTLAGGNLSFAVFGTNLTDKFYLQGGTALTTVSGVAFREIARPREIGATARLKF